MFYGVFARVCEVFLDLTQPTVKTDSHNTADQSSLQLDHLLFSCAALHLAKTQSTVIGGDALTGQMQQGEGADVNLRLDPLLTNRPVFGQVM